MARRHEPCGARHARVADERRAGRRVLGHRDLLHAGPSQHSALLAGLAASAAILIRPNLAPLAVVLVSWKFWSATAGLKASTTTDDAGSDRSADLQVGRRRAVAPMIAGTIPGCLFIAWINNSALRIAARVGIRIAVGAVFALAHRHQHRAVRRAGSSQSQTPLAVVGIAALLLPVKCDLAHARAADRPRCLLGASVIVVWALYLIYTPFEAWWFLRFLLPAWPAMCLGAAAVVVRIAQTRRIAVRVLACAILAVVGAHNLYYASTHGAFPSGEGDHRYVSIAKMVEQATDPSAVDLYRTAQRSDPLLRRPHDCPLRYAGSRVARSRRAMAERQGRRPYFLLEEWEMTAFQERFARSERARHDRARSDRRLPRARRAGARVSVRSCAPRWRYAHHDAARRAPTPSACGPSPLLHWR